MIFRNDIQGLRAIAFIFVFIFHLNSNFLPGGFLGVDIFFVISGFLMSSIVVSNIDNKKFNFIDFYFKRLKRIIPAYYVCVLLVYLCGMFMYSYIDFYSSLNTSFKYAFVFLSNFFFENGESYFGPNLSENPYLHTWSLGVEMQFYLFLPFLLYYGRKYLSFILPILLIISVMYSCKLIYFDDNLTASYFSLISRISEFTIGVFYAHYFNKGFFKNNLYNDAVTWISLITLLLCVFIYHENMNFPGFLCLIPCIATANILIGKNTFLLNFLSNKCFVFIGSLSFSLYLWHWPIMAYLRYENGFYEFSIFQVFLICFLTFTLSYLSYTYVEVFFMKLQTKFFLVSMFLIATITSLFFLNKESLIEYKKIPDVYSRPILGLKSHFEGIVEKFGSKEKEPTFLFIGNSHALMLKPFLNQIGQKNGFSFYSLTCDAYPSIAGITLNRFNDKENLLFAQKQSALTYQYIDKVSLVIIAVNNFNEFNIPIKQLADRLLKQNKKLLIINSFPTLEDVNILKINKGYINKIGKLEKNTSDSLSFLKIRQLASESKNVLVYDLSKSQLFKNAPFYKDTLIYYDSNHLNHYGSLKLAEDLGNDFNAFLVDNLKD